MIKKILVHAILWILFFCIIAYGFTINLNSTVVTPEGSHQTDFILLPMRLELNGILFKLAFFYVSISFIFPKMFRRNSIVAFVTASILNILFFFSLETFFLKSVVLGEMFSKNVFTTKAYTYYLYRVNPLMYFILVILVFIYFFTSEWIRNEKTKNFIRQEHLKAELELLKYQINPHFLFNTLNNFYSIAQQQKVPELEQGILKLSGMMRYILYECNLDLMPLAKELEYINNYISIYQYKFDKKDNFDLTINITGNPEGKYISPLLFLPLVENALKHGFKINRNCFVHINFTIVPNAIELSIQNSFYFDSNMLKDNYGIGLVNIKKRLELIYPNDYILEANPGENIFTTLLKVPLHEY